jgi:hypothetical protein
MAFPSDATPMIGEMLIDGAYVNVTSDIRGNPGVKITRGKRDIQGSTPPTFCDFMLNNGGEDPADRGKYTDDNPMSPYFGLLPLNTEFRIIVPGAADGYLYTTGYDDANYVSTADKAALDITGDIDIRAEISPASWHVPVDSTTSTSHAAIIVSKAGASGSQFSWMLALRTSSQLYFVWSPTGSTGAGLAILSNTITPTDRLAVRVTLDVNNGSGGYTGRFYTSTSIDGSWTLNSTITVGGGTTSIHSGTGLLEIGSSNGGGHTFSNFNTWSGKIYAVEVYNGIAGTLVADADFRAQGVGATGFSDGVGNTYAVNGTAFITSDAVRFWGEIESLPQEWDSTGKDMYVPIHAADITQRLNTSQTPVNSPIYDNRIQVDPTGYWTGEDGADATRMSAASRDTNSASATGVRFKAADDLPGSNGVMQFVDGSAFVRGIPRISSITGTASVLFFFKFGTLPATTVQLISCTTTGSGAYWWRIETDGASFTARAFSADGTSLLSSAILVGTDVNLDEWISMRLELTTSGANIAWALAWHQVGQSVFWGGSGTIAGSVGRFTGFTVSGSSANTDMYFAHVVLDTDTTDFVSAEFADAANGYISETMAARFKRVCEQAGIVADLDGWEMDTSALGRQPIDTVMNILQDGAKVDGGILLGSRRRYNTLTYVTRARIQTSVNTVTLEHDGGSHLAESPKPIKDSIGVANDVTVTRPNGGFARRVIVEGRYGTDTIGKVPGGGEYNVEEDDDTDAVAGWIALLGTWNESRFPEIKVELSRTETLFASSIAQQILVVDAGRWLTIDNLPAGQKPDAVEQLIQGYSETLSNKMWSLTFNGTPYGPWRVGIVESPLIPPRVMASETTCSSATSTATSLTFNTPATSARWVRAADVASTPFPFDVMIAGERITVTDITGTGTAQTATVTRSVNGVVKEISGDPEVQLYYLTVVGR